MTQDDQLREKRLREKRYWQEAEAACVRFRDGLPVFRLLRTRLFRRIATGITAAAIGAQLVACARIEGHTIESYCVDLPTSSFELQLTLISVVFVTAGIMAWEVVEKIQRRFRRLAGKVNPFDVDIKATVLVAGFLAVAGIIPVGAVLAGADPPPIEVFNTAVPRWAVWATGMWSLAALLLGFVMGKLRSWERRVASEARHRELEALAEEDLRKARLAASACAVEEPPTEKISTASVALDLPPGLVRNVVLDQRMGATITDEEQRATLGTPPSGFGRTEPVGICDLFPSLREKEKRMAVNKARELSCKICPRTGSTLYFIDGSGATETEWEAEHSRQSLALAQKHHDEKLATEWEKHRNVQSMARDMIDKALRVGPERIRVDGMPPEAEVQADRLVLAGALDRLAKAGHQPEEARIATRSDFVSALMPIVAAASMWNAVANGASRTAEMTRINKLLAKFRDRLTVSSAEVMADAKRLKHIVECAVEAWFGGASRSGWEEDKLAKNVLAWIAYPGERGELVRKEVMDYHAPDAKPLPYKGADASCLQAVSCLQAALADIDGRLDDAGVPRMGGGGDIQLSRWARIQALASRPCDTKHHCSEFYQLAKLKDFMEKRGFPPGQACGVGGKDISTAIIELIGAAEMRQVMIPEIVKARDSAERTVHKLRQDVIPGLIAERDSAKRACETLEQLTEDDKEDEAEDQDEQNEQNLRLIERTLLHPERLARMTPDELIRLHARLDESYSVDDDEDDDDDA